jgi:hypothetical protein
VPDLQMSRFPSGLRVRGDDKALGRGGNDGSQHVVRFRFKEMSEWFWVLEPGRLSKEAP